MRIKIQSPYKIVCLLLFALLVIWLGSRFVGKDSAPEASRYLYLMKTSTDDVSYRDIYRFEEGGEVPIRLSLEGVQGVVEGFCATEGKLYLCCREGDRYYLEECDADGRFLRLVADSRQVSELESVFWPTMYAEGEHLYFLYDTSYDVSYRQALEALPRTEEGAIYNGRWEYICLDIETGTASRTGLYAPFKVDGQPQGIWQEKDFSYSSSFLYADQPSGQVKVGYSFYCREEQAEQGYLLPVDSKLLDSYGYPGRSCDGDARYGWHQDGRTLYCNFRNPDGEVELFAVTVKKGAIQDCQKMEEADGLFLLFARQGHLLLENQEGELYDYTKKAGLKKLGRPAAAYSNTTYVTYSAEPGFWIKSDCMVTDGLVRQLPQGEEICFLYWYEGEMIQEYLLEGKEPRGQFGEWDLPLKWEALNAIPEPFALFPKLPEQAEANKLWERTEDPAGEVERILLWQEEGEILLGFQLAEGKKCQVLTLYKENEASEVYLESLDIRKYQDVCGTSGYFIEYIEGAGARKEAYYGMKNGMLEPVLFGYNGIYEVDCDGDGQTEVISTYRTCPESWVYDYRENEIWQCSLNLLLERKIEELTGVNRKTSVSYNEEEGQFEYSILPEEGMQNREERGALVIKTVGEHLVLKMEEY